jgi:hypothetical protein
MARLQKMGAALKAARPIIAGELQCEIESFALPEKKRRPGSIKGCTGSFYNPDTIDHQDAISAVKRCQRALALIDEALA